MAFVNYNNKEITIKIVYYGPALSGKTTCLKYIYSSKEFQKKGKLITLDTDGDRTLFFDFLPVEVGTLGDYTIKMQLYTVPGQVAYDTTRKLVLQGADGVVFVADSQKVMRDQNIDSFHNLKTNLGLNNISFAEIPIILHYNKRDLHDVMSLDQLNDDLNTTSRPFFPTTATSGENILEGLTSIMKLVIIYLKNRLSIFQKDKTVMFSREQMANVKPVATGPAAKKSASASDSGIRRGDTAKESPFEAKPAVKEERIVPDTPSGNDIFNLGDENLVVETSDDPIFDVPEVSLEDAMKSDDHEVVEAEEYIDLREPAPEPDEAFSLSQTDMIEDAGAQAVTGTSRNPSDTDHAFTVRADSDSGNPVTVPVVLTIPPGQTEITLHLKLHIKVSGSR